MLALSACTQTYYKEFAVSAQDRSYGGRAQYEDIKGYLLSRGLRTVIETNNFLEVEIEKGDTLQVRLLPTQTVELTIVRRTSGADFTPLELRAFRENLERVLRERSGHTVAVRLTGERVRPLTNIQ